MFALFMFLGQLMDWIRAGAAIATAFLIRRPLPSAAVAAAVGAVQGMVGTRFELIDFVFSVEGWAVWLNPSQGLIPLAISVAARLTLWAGGRGLAVPPAQPPSCSTRRSSGA